MFPLKHGKLARNSGPAEEGEPKGRRHLAAHRSLGFLVCVRGTLCVCDGVRAVARTIPARGRDALREDTFFFLGAAD